MKTDWVFVLRLVFIAVYAALGGGVLTTYAMRTNPSIFGLVIGLFALAMVIVYVVVLANSYVHHDEVKK